MEPTTPEQLQQYMQMLKYGSIAAVVGLIYCIYQLSRAYTEKSSPAGRTRRMSFNSSVMVSGGFPSEAKVWAPIINCLFLVKECPSNVALIGACKKLLHFDRFRSKVVFDGTNYHFVECDLNFADHIKTVGVVSEADVLAEADRIATNDLDQSMPMWCFHRITNKGTGLSALLIRVHHVIGDGIALVNAIQKILDDENGNPVTIKLPGAKVREAGAVRPPAPSTFSIVKSFFNIVSLPASPFDTKTSFTPSNQKKIVMNKRRKTLIFPSVKLSFIKDLKNKAGATINDILLTAVTGAVRKYCKQRGDVALEGNAKSSILSRCLMPVALPRSKKIMEDPTLALINRWVFLSVPLPMEATTAVERLEQCKAVTSEVRTTTFSCKRIFSFACDLL